MLNLLILCPVLLAAGVQTLTIDSQLGTSIEDCFERISIGEQLPPNAIYRNVTELTTRECEQLCKQDKQCQSYDYGVGAKGNATCNLSKTDEKSLKEENLLLRHPDYDVYVRRFQCEQSPPSPIQPQYDEPSDVPNHRPVFRPVDEEKSPFYDDYLISGDLESYGVKRPVYRPQHYERPDDYSNPKPDYDVGPSYGAHKPQDIPYTAEKPSHSGFHKPKPDPYDVLQFQDPYKPNNRPGYPVNDYDRPIRPSYVPEKPEYQYIIRPNRKPNPQGSKPDYPVSSGYGQADSDYGSKPYQNNRPFNRPRPGHQRPPNSYDEISLYEDNSIKVQIKDPPTRPYQPPKLSSAEGIYGYGTYSNQNSYSQSQIQSQSHYYGSSISSNNENSPHRPDPKPQRPSYEEESDFGYGSSVKPQKPSYGTDRPSYGNEKPPHDSERPSYGNNKPTYGNYMPSYGNGNQPYSPGKPTFSDNRPSYGGEKPSYGNNKPTYGNDRPSYDGEKPSHGNNKPTYGNNRPSYGDDRPNYSIEKPSYGNDLSYVPIKPSYGSEKPSHITQKPQYGVDKPSYDVVRPSYAPAKPTYEDDNPSFGIQGSYGNAHGSYNSHQTSYGIHNYVPQGNQDPNNYILQRPHSYRKPSKTQVSHGSHDMYGSNQSTFIDQGWYDSIQSFYGNQGYGGTHGLTGGYEPNGGPEYGSNQSVYGQGYVGHQGFHGASHSSNSNKDSYGMPQTTYGGTYHNSGSSYGTQSSYTTQTSHASHNPYGSQSYGGSQGLYGGSSGSHGSAQGSYGSNQSSYGGQSDYNKPYNNRPQQDRPGYGKPQKPKPSYENDDADTGYGNKPSIDENRPDYINPSGSEYGNDSDKPGYGNEKPNSTGYYGKPNIKPVYEYELEKPGNVPSYIARPGGDVVTSRPMVIGDFGDGYVPNLARKPISKGEC